MRAIPIDINWHPGLSIYASDRFLSLVADEYGWLGGVDESGGLRCILPYTVIKKAMFRLIRFRVETIPLEEDFSLEEEKLFLNSVMEYFRYTGADMVIPATTNSVFRTYPVDAISAPYGSFVLDLSQPEEILWDNLHSKHRNVIRSALKKGVKIRSGSEDLSTVYELVRDTLKRSNLGFMRYEDFKGFVLGLGENVKILVADYGGSAQGCAVFPFSSYGAYYLYGGSLSHPVTGAMNLLHWEALREFRTLEVRRYDFVGTRIAPEKHSKQEGLKKFKERFGGNLIRGYIWKYSINRLKYCVYNLAVYLQRGGDIVDQERLKV